MRALGVIGILASAALAQDLTPRAGSGWEGFKPGTWVKIKRTPIQQNRMLTVTVMTSTLERAGDKTLTLRTVSKNALGLVNNDLLVLPRSGEAGKGETQAVEKLAPETVIAGGRKYECARVRTTVSGPTGKRIVTNWIASKPKVWAKRTEVYRDKKGKVTLRSTLLLADVNASREVAGRTLRCVKYRIRRTAGTSETTGDIYMSRAVPGSLVFEETLTRAGKVEVTMRAEVLGFATK